LHSTPNIEVTKLRRIRCAGHVARMGGRRGAYRVLVGKPKEKRPLGRPRRRREYCVEINFQEVDSGHGLV
jgi:hypothetical protein